MSLESVTPRNDKYVTNVSQIMNK